MSFDRYKARDVVKIYNEYFRGIPISELSIYKDENHCEYIEPLEKIKNLLSQQFRYNKDLESIDIKEAWSDGAIECMYINELGYVIRDMILSEKVYIGAIGAMLTNGQLERVINRLGILTGAKKENGYSYSQKA